MSLHLSLQSIAELVGGKIEQGDPQSIITGINSIAEAVEGELTFLGNERYLPALQSTRASAVLVGPSFTLQLPGKALIRVDNPTFSFTSAIRHFGKSDAVLEVGVHPQAVVSNKARFNPQKVSIAAGAVIGDDVEIGDGCRIGALCSIGAGAKLGEDCLLHPGSIVGPRSLLGNRVVLQSGAVVGSDGFGYELIKGRHVKVDQIGIAQLDDDVEVGANSTIDRARFGRTWIGEGTKIDNLVQIAHNAVIGKHCVIVAHTGIAGSVRMGDYVTIAGFVGVAGHLEICSQVLILAKSGVTKNITEPGAYVGFPAKPLMEGRRQMTAASKVPELLQRLRELERQVAALKGETPQAKDSKE
jgi:UDP-3-O-[3-hydroxymyristoyl] glucosamine N-acyltransferase